MVDCNTVSWVIGEDTKKKYLVNKNFKLTFFLRKIIFRFWDLSKRFMESLPSVCVNIWIIARVFFVVSNNTSHLSNNFRFIILNSLPRRSYRAQSIECIFLLVLARGFILSLCFITCIHPTVKWRLCVVAFHWVSSRLGSLKYRKRHFE